MGKYNNGSHTVYDIKYHFVWITKYRYKVLQGSVAVRLRELLRQGCEARGLEIIRGKYKQRPRTYAFVLSSDNGSERHHEVSERTFVTYAAR